MLSEAVVVGLAAFWAWTVTSMAGPFTPLRRALLRLPAGSKLVGCPFCLGAWYSIIGTVVLHAATQTLSWQTPAVALAAAGVCGLLGSYLPVDLPEEQ